MRYAKFVCVLVSVAGILSAADNPAIGAWKLNVTKSKYSPGPAPTSATMKYEETADGIRRTGESIDAQGKPSSFEYTAKFDGKDYPLKGSEVYDAISMKRINDHTSEATLKKSGKVVTNARRVVSKDGKTLTLTTIGTNAKGEKFKNVAVYEKQ